MYGDEMPHFVNDQDDDAPGYLLWRLTLRWRAAVDRAVAPFGLTHAQYSLLAALDRLGRTGVRPSQRELADYAGLDPIYVSKLARALERAGMLVRTEHPADSRAVRLTVTRHGTDVALRAGVVVRELQEQAAAPIGGTASMQSREFVRTLKALLAPQPQADDQDSAEFATGR
jgi:DNA-binding MarR family transcriptional regulator